LNLCPHFRQVRTILPLPRKPVQMLRRFSTSTSDEPQFGASNGVYHRRPSRLARILPPRTILPAAIHFPGATYPANADESYYSDPYSEDTARWVRPSDLSFALGGADVGVRGSASEALAVGWRVALAAEPRELIPCRKSNQRRFRARISEQRIWSGALATSENSNATSARRR
jgi:hypothetical protein